MQEAQGNPGGRAPPEPRRDPVDDQNAAAGLIALAAVIALRVLDYFLPKGRTWKWIREHTVAVEDDKDGDVGG